MATIQDIEDWFTEDRRDILKELAPIKYGYAKEQFMPDPCLFLNNQIVNLKGTRAGSSAQKAALFHLKNLKTIVNLQHRINSRGSVPA